MRQLIFPLILIQIGLSVPAIAQAPTDTPLENVTILILHSYQIDFPWTRDLDSSIRTVLDAGVAGPHTIVSEFLDAKRFSSDGYTAMMRDVLAYKYIDRRVDLIITTDNKALDFLNIYRDEVFGEIPVVFTGVNNYRQMYHARIRGVTGVTEEIGFAPLIEYLQETMPQRRTLVVLGDGTRTYANNLSTLGRALREANWNGDILIPDDYTSDGAQRALESVPAGRGAVLLIASLVDTAPDSGGTVMDFTRAAELVASFSDQPVVAFWDFQLHTGVLGGYVIDPAVQGSTAADLAVRIINGEAVESIPVVRGVPKHWAFDYSAMERFGLRMAELPDGATVYNAPDSLWVNYRGTVILAGSIFLILLGLVGALTVTSAAHRRSIQEKDALLREIHHRVKNNLQVISSILNLQSTYVIDADSVSLFRDCESRIHSMALVHEQVYQSDDFLNLQLKEYLEMVTTMVRATVDIPDARIQTIVTVDPTIRISMDAAVNAGLIVQELVSNAFKYAYPGNETPEHERIIRISAFTRPPNLVITVEDSGAGFDPAAIREQNRSLGLQLIDALASQLGGTIAYLPGSGTRTELVIPG